MSILQVITGIAFLFFIPGFLLVLILFKKLNLLEKIILTIGFSISINIFLGLLLAITKIYTRTNLYIALILISVIFLLFYLYKKFLIK
jgi:uncharacterized membrane protein